MSGDDIKTLKIVNEQPLNINDLEYVKKLLEPFETIVIERFSDFSTTAATNPAKRNIFSLIALGLVLFINFPKVKEKFGLSEYILWLISAFLLVGVVY